MTADVDVRLYAARYAPGGSVVPGWTPGTFQVAPGVSEQDLAQVIPTPDSGNLFCFWNGYDTPDIWMQRLSSDGHVAPGWPAGGHEVAAGPGWQNPGQQPSLLPDQADGAWLTYGSEFSDVDGDAYVLHVDGFGNPAPGWPIYGLRVTNAPGFQTETAIAADSAGGVYVAWADARSRAGLPWDQAEFGLDIYLQRITAGGEVVAGWPADGLPVCVWDHIQQAPRLVADGAGGVYVAWELFGPEGFMFHAQHILADGSIAPGWPQGGRRLFSLEGYGAELRVVSDQMGGLFAAGQILDGTNSWHVYVQHVTFAGVFDAPWGAAGLRLATVGGLHDDQENPEMVTSFPGSVIVCWDDMRAGYAESYVQRVSMGGLVATEVSLSAQEVTAEHVSLTWIAADAGITDVFVERCATDSEWRELASLTPDGAGHLTYEDRDIVQGRSYRYRLRYSSAGQVVHSSETAVAVPAPARFAPRGAAPNPAARGDLRVAYSLAERGPARLELFDAQGRCVATRDLTLLGAGEHTVKLDSQRPLHSGIYWLRLAQGERRATSRVVVVE